MSCEALKCQRSTLWASTFVKVKENHDAVTAYIAIDRFSESTHYMYNCSGTSVDSTAPLVGEAARRTGRLLSPEGKVVEEKYVDYTPGVPKAMVDLKAKLIQEYARHEAKRVREYNTCCIVNLARRRIAKSSKGSLPFCCMSHFGCSETLLLGRHVPNHPRTLLVPGTNQTTLSATHR
jgi:hypothetical protein